MKIGFIGLGTLGKTMAKRLISEDIPLIVWNRTPEKAKDLGVPIAASPAELMTKTDIVFLSLTDSDAVYSILSGDGGLLEGDCRNKIIIDTTTNHFEPVILFHETLREKEGFYLESPVLGSVMPASKGMLTVLVSGDRAAFERAKPVIEKISRNIFYLKEPSLATKMKLVNNLVLGSFMATLAEATSMGENIGLEKEKVLEILSKGAGDSMILNAKREKILSGDFTSQFSCAMIYKDLHYLHDLAGNLKRPLMTGAIIKEIYAMTFPNGLQDQDFSAVYKLF